MNLPTLRSLRSLQSRIRASTGADRGLDAEICAALRYSGAAYQKWVFEYPRWLPRSDGSVQLEKDGPHFVSPKLTADPDGLGACKALQRSLFPISVRDVVDGQCGATVQLFIKPAGIVLRTEHDLETHAHLLAIIAAVIADIEADQSEAVT